MIRSVLLSMKGREDLGWRALHELELALDALVDLEKRIVPLVGKATFDDHPLVCGHGHRFRILDLELRCTRIGHRQYADDKKIKWSEEYKVELGRRDDA
jgi:hypothetical protein